MAKKLFIGNLPFTMTDDSLTQIFSAYGKVVSANVVFDKFSHRSKGFAFVEFETEEEAKAAMQALDGSEQEGRNIAVKEALPRPERTDAPTQG
jgi:RNA recognition motif-containing protein